MTTLIADIMTRQLSTVGPDDDLQRAAQLMRDADIGALPVCEGDRLVGMVTDRDITVRASARGIAPGGCKVRDVMSADTAWCFEDQSVGEVLQQMGDRQVRRLPVFRRDSMQLAGMVALADLATRQAGPTGSTLADISAPLPPQRPATGKPSGIP